MQIRKIKPGVSGEDFGGKGVRWMVTGGKAGAAATAAKAREKKMLAEEAKRRQGSSRDG